MQNKIVIVLSLVFLSQLSGCASQQIQQQLIAQQQVQQTQAVALAEYQQQITAQQNLLMQLNERQLQTLEMIDGNTAQLIQIAEQKPIINLVAQPQAAVNTPSVAEPIKSTPTPTSPPKMTVGRVEWVWIDKLDDFVKARIDTGARSSSIHATDIQYFERDGKNWVRFKMHTHKAKKGAKSSDKAVVEPAYEVPVLRMVKIRQASAAEMERRPVVKLRVRIDQFEDDAEFTLTNRSGMIYPVLLGRGFLKDVIVVDVANAFLHKRDEAEQE
ncbi:MAG: ATP-dependent zinc protease [Marinagarivorans sp.]|nr:ATP-dependent zinc protease [Marinagarivorans sp.]